jgi:hypothetical protein
MVPDIATRTIFQASGTRNGSGLTTVAICSNRGSVAATIGAAFYQYDGTLPCTSYYFGVMPGETRSIGIDPVVSMGNVSACPGAPAIGQGRIEIFASPDATLKFDCTVMVIDKANDPPLSMTRLTLYTGDGAPISDVIFADSFDP